MICDKCGSAALGVELSGSHLILSCRCGWCRVYGLKPDGRFTPLERNPVVYQEEETELKPRTCKKCGSGFKSHGYRRYCEACKKTLRKKQLHASYKRYRRQ